VVACKRELLYQGDDGQILVVSYTAVADSFIADKPQPRFDEPLFETQNARSFDLHPNGERIVGVTARESTAKQDKVVLLSRLVTFENTPRIRSPCAVYRGNVQFSRGRCDYTRRLLQPSSGRSNVRSLDAHYSRLRSKGFLAY
jgi:hypothetical protein